MDRVGLTTVVAQCRPHAVHVHAWTVGGAGLGYTPWVAPQCGHAWSVWSVTVDGPVIGSTLRTVGFHLEA
jgi:hypothetical protein